METQRSTERPHDIPRELLDAVTRSPVKAHLFGIDTYTREAAWTFRDHTGELLRTALCVLKPDAAVGRRYGAALQALADNGFRPVDVLRFRHDRLSIRETWRFQLNFADRERIATMELYLRSLDCVLLVLRDERHRAGAVPAAVRLAALKGPATAELRRPEHLRERLGALNGLFNFLHTTDEPIDVLRDLGLLLEPSRRELVRERMVSGHDATDETRRIREEVEGSVPEHDLDPDAGWRRLEKSGSPAGALARARARGAAVTPAELLRAAHHPDADPGDLWDLLAVLTATVRFNTPGIERIYPNVLLGAWQEPA
ncbi:nucleoside-diphosphate kinase [Streptomyces abyssomicinicus]|uniref:nucleoside-diphosphate kinase n=1 Tax=Streptomyces abyssomicinicus TaxID=574929 RepID=UPI0013E0D0CC|nr:nucleoside-diphosphate kinase [Streptomyces abyssomicinicus]